MFSFGPHPLLLPKVRSGHKSCDNWAVTRVQGGHCSLQTMPDILYKMTGWPTFLFRAQRGSIFIAGLMTWQGWDLIHSTAAIRLLAASLTAEPINSGPGAGSWKEEPGLVLIKDWSCMLILLIQPHSEHVNNTVQNNVNIQRSDWLWLDILTSGQSAAAPRAPVLVPHWPPHVPDVDHLLGVIEAQKSLQIFSVCLKW